MEEEHYQDQEITFKLWHGTSEENAKKIFEASEENAKKIVGTFKWHETIENEKPFFGNGVYFMKDNKNFACLWAKYKHPDSQRAILCFVKVKRKFIFDLAVDKCYKFYEKFSKKVLKNVKFSSSMINAICESIETGTLNIEPIKVVIGYYSLGVLNESDKTPDKCINKTVKIQIQIVVRDQSLIEIERVEDCQREC